jgi:hypothetical protein
VNGIIDICVIMNHVEFEYMCSIIKMHEAFKRSRILCCECSNTLLYDNVSVVLDLEKGMTCTKYYKTLFFQRIKEQ